MEKVFHGHTSSIMHGAMLVGVCFTKTWTNSVNFHSSIGGLSWWRRWVGGVGLYRVGWNLGEVGERAGWRAGTRVNCTILHTDEVMGPRRLCHPRRHKRTSDDPSSRACEAPSHVCQHPHATQHEKTWVRKMKRNFALLHGQTPKSVF